MSLQLDMRAHCELSSVQGAGGTRTLTNGGTGRPAATLMRAVERLDINKSQRSTV